MEELAEKDKEIARLKLALKEGAAGAEGVIEEEKE